jgi:hypothetical protein
MWREVFKNYHAGKELICDLSQPRLKERYVSNTDENLVRNTHASSGPHKLRSQRPLCFENIPPISEET